MNKQKPLFRYSLPKRIYISSWETQFPHKCLHAHTTSHHLPTCYKPSEGTKNKTSTRPWMGPGAIHQHGPHSSMRVTLGTAVQFLLLRQRILVSILEHKIRVWDRLHLMARAFTCWGSVLAKSGTQPETGPGTSNEQKKNPLNIHH